MEFIRKEEHLYGRNYLYVAFKLERALRYYL